MFAVTPVLPIRIVVSAVLVLDVVTVSDRLPLSASALSTAAGIVPLADDTRIMRCSSRSDDMIESDVAFWPTRISTLRNVSGVLPVSASPFFPFTTKFSSGFFDTGDADFERSDFLALDRQRMTACEGDGAGALANSPSAFARERNLA